MNIVWSIEINTILSIGHYLDDTGIHNWTLTREQSFIVLDQFTIKRIAILGIDIYESKKGKISPTYDNWFCKRQPTKSEETFIKQSIIQAHDFIFNYKKYDKKPLFAIVPKTVSI